MTQGYDIQSATWDTYLALHNALRDPSASASDIHYNEQLLTGLLQNNDFAGGVWSYAKDNMPEQFDAVRRDIGRAQATPVTAQGYGGAQFFQDLLENGQLEGLNIVEAYTAPEPTTQLQAEEVAPENNITWDDNQIVSTYDQLLTLNPESVSEASALTQEAYAFAQSALELQIQHEQYIDDPAAYIRNGNLPPSDQALIDAEDSAYEHLANLSSEDGQALSTEVSQIATNDAAHGIIPLAPEIIAGQQYLESIGLNSSGTAFLETPEIDSAPSIPMPEVDTSPSIQTAPSLLSVAFPHAAAAPAIDTSSATPLNNYQVQAGDSLWNIAHEEYGLTNATDIMRAVDHIAHANGLQNGTDANHIAEGQELVMPTANQITQDVNSINWSALHQETQSNLNQGGAYANTGQQGIAAAPSI